MLSWLSERAWVNVHCCIIHNPSTRPERYVCPVFQDFPTPVLPRHWIWVQVLQVRRLRLNKWAPIVQIRIAESPRSRQASFLAGAGEGMETHLSDRICCTPFYSPLAPFVSHHHDNILVAPSFLLVLCEVLQVVAQKRDSSIWKSGWKCDWLLFEN